MSLPAQNVSVLRLPAIDAARGYALLAMFTYHLTWDLGYFDLITPQIPASPWFKLYGHCIAATFLSLVGVGLVLAARNGFRLKPYLQRLGMVAGAAAAITLITYYAFPESFIFFGVLHLIAVASIVALPFLIAPIWVTLSVAAGVFALPFVAASQVFDQPIWWWSGLGFEQPNSNDWRPFFPWFGFTLVGMALTQVALARGIPSVIAQWTPRDKASRALVLGGRHSLLAYLVHQPVFMAIVFVASQLMPARIAMEEAPFLAQCRSQCVASGAAQQVCVKLCSCVASDLHSANLWRNVVSQPLTPMEQERVNAITRICARTANELAP